ncbi:cobalamin B12-binding domain-containing protein [Candidatus Hakubella thermalkaliphila]|nr:corrinoid protein [Candidatus Hakubella thermalkaliphila]
MNKEEVFASLTSAIVDLDEEKVKSAAAKVLELGIDPVEAIEKGLSKGMEIIGEKFRNLEVFLPELIMAADIFSTATQILGPEIAARKLEQPRKGKIVIGTVKGDIHKIGKDIVAMLLEVAGFEVHNLGEDVATSAFIKEAERVKADIIGLSSLLTSTMPAQKDLIDILKEKGVRDKYKIVVGGGPVSPEWAEQIGTDGYAETAEDAVSLALELVSQRK